MTYKHDDPAYLINGGQDVKVRLLKYNDDTLLISTGRQSNHDEGVIWEWCFVLASKEIAPGSVIAINKDKLTEYTFALGIMNDDEGKLKYWECVA